MAENYSPRTSGGASSLPPIWKKRLDPAIHVRVYKNGDTNFAGKTITLDRGKTRNFDSWLVELSNNMKLRSGAVWRVFTPTQGHRVDNFDRFEDGSAIVVGGQERFKPISYAQIDPNPKRRGPVSYDPDPLRARRYQVSGKYKKVDIHGKIIKCWANGNETDAPRPVLLPAYRNKPVTLEGVIELVSGMLCNQCGGPVERLYLPDGTRVMSMDQILPNGHYVAARKYDLFKHSNYKEQTLHNFGNHSPTMMRKHMELAPIRSNKTSSHSSPEHSNASHNGHRREKVRKEEEGGIPGRPIKHKRSSDKSRGSDTAREVDYDADRGGVFKAKQENKATKGAKPIDDSRHTRTELPIDKRRAEEVQDEEDGDRFSAQDDDHEDEEIKGRKDKKGKKDEAARGPPTQPPAAGQEREEQQRTFRANSKQPGAPTDEQAQQDARARREKEDRERTEKQQKEREALQRKKDDKKTKEQEDKLRKEEEERKKKEAERKSVEEKRKKEETERKKVADEEKRKKEEEEKRKKEGEKKKKEVEDKKRKDQEEEDEHLEEERQKKLEQARKKDATKPQQKNTYDDEDDEDDRSPSAIRREENRRQAEREAEAAIKIQAAARGHLARKRVKLMKEERRAQQEATSGGRDSSLMRDDPIPLASDEDWGPAPTDDYDQQEREQAAIKIQSGFRGYKARQRVKQMRAEREG